MHQPDPNQIAQALHEQGLHLQYVTANLLDVRRRMTVLEATMSLAAQGRAARFPVEFKSEFGEDLFFWELFRGKQDGFFIEVGAYDGYRGSVSYAFEAVGWKGLLIEPLPHRYEQCAARRTGSRVVHAALGAKGAAGEVELTVVQDDAWDMSSYTGDHPMHRVALDTTSHQRKKVRVPYTSMDALLEGHVGAIDFAMIDVEGSEVDVLKGFDLKKWRPRALMLEDNTAGKDARLTQYMQTQPYLFFSWLGVNQIYIRNDDKELIERAPQVKV